MEEQTNTPVMPPLVPPKEAPAEETPVQSAPDSTPKQPTPEELQAEFRQMLRTPIDAAERKEAAVQALLCDIQVAQLEQAIAGLEATIAANKAEVAKVRLAKAIITRRLANK